jgi:hypothetical protein
MAKLTIIKESTAQRCEICHQSDRFDPAFNTCSRCNNLNLGDAALNIRNSPAQVAYWPQQVIIPNNVTIEELGNTFTIIYRSGSIKHALPLLAVSLNMFNNILRPWLSPQNPGPHFIFWLSAIWIPLFILIVVTLITKKTYITITDDQIIKHDVPWTRITKKTINIKEIANFEFNNKVGWDKLFLILKNGKRVKLISNKGDRDGMELIERVLKERLAKK